MKYDKGLYAQLVTVDDDEEYRNLCYCVFKNTDNKNRSLHTLPQNTPLDPKR